jgi:hypothetical protein
LRKLTGVGQRLAIFAEHVEILRSLDRRGLNDRNGLIVSRQRPQGAGIFNRGCLLARVTVVTLAQFVGVSPELGVVCRLAPRFRNRAGDIAKIVAAGEQGCRARERGHEP